jgi:shikimate kinase
MTLPFNLILVGPMGAGKSTIGRRLAQMLSATFLDSDKEIEQRTGASIPLIFELEGETGFRSREHAMIDELTLKPNLVLATGGGAILDPENRAHMSARGKVIYLLTSVDQQLRRTHRDTNRPLLNTENPEQRLLELFRVRDPLYREIADLTVETDGKTVQLVCSEILRKLGLKAKKDGKPRQKARKPRR